MRGNKKLVFAGVFLVFGIFGTKIIHAQVGVGVMPGMTLVSPNGGETYVAGNTVPITWHAPGVTSSDNSFGISVYSASNPQKIVLSTTVGDQAVSGGISATGTYNWVIPSTVPAGTYDAYVSWANGWVQSASPFTISGPTPAPTVSFNLSPSTIILGESATITWSSTNTTACTAYGPTGSSWTGTVAVSGSQTITPTTVGANQSFTIQCSGAGGTTNTGNTVTVGAPVASLSLTSPNGSETYTAGNTVPISWSATGVTSSNNSFGISVYSATNAQNIVFSTTVGNPSTSAGISGAGTYNWVIPSTVPAGTYDAYVSWGSHWAQSASPFTITKPVVAPIPTISFNLSPSTITLGQSFTIIWSATNATACTAYGPTGSSWTGTVAVNGSQTITPTAVGANQSFTIQCSGAGGTTNTGNTVTVNPKATTAAPYFSSIELSPANITLGQSATITWSALNATTCTASGAWSGSEPVNGMVSVTPTGAGSDTYTLTCVGTGGTISSPLTLIVNPPADTLSPIISITSPSNLEEFTPGSSITINYSTSGSFSTPNGLYFVYLKNSPAQLLGNNTGYGVTYDPFLFRSTTLPSSPLTFTIPSTWSGTSYIEMDYTDNSANVITSATSQPFIVNAATNPTSTTEGTLSFSQTSFAATYVEGSPLPSTLSNSPNVYTNTPYSQSLTFTNTSNVPVTYTISVPNQPAWLDTSYATQPLTATPGTPTGIGAYLNPTTVANASGTYTTNIIITGNFVGSPQVIPVTLTVTASSVTQNPPNTVLEQELQELITLLIQLLQQAAAQGAISPSQLNSTLHSIGK